MLNSNDMLPIAITFNSDWPVKSDVDDWPGATASVSYALSVISRIASVLYGLNILEARTLILQSAQSLLHKKWDETPVDASNVIRAFIMHIIRAVNLVRGERGPIKYAIVMVDESMVIEKHIVDTFAVSNITSILRSAVLDVNFTACVHFSLLISSLKVDAFGFTLAGRGVFEIKLPANLPASEVVDSWWLRGDSSERIEVNDGSRKALYNLAATMNSNMRMCEIAADYIQQLHAKNGTPINFLSKKGDQGNLKNLIVNIRQKIKKRYAEFTVPFGLLHSIVYGGEVSVVDADVANALQQSVITNSAPPKGDAFVPQSSFLALLTMVKNFGIGRVSMESILESMQKYTLAGDVSESFLQHWIKVRLFVAFSQPDATLSLSSLLGMDSLDFEGFDGEFGSLLVKPLEIGDPRFIKVYHLSSMSYDDNGGQALAMELKNIKVSAGSPVVIAVPMEKEAFDLALKVYRHDKAPLFVLIDCKSAVERGKKTRPSSLTLKQRTEDGKQSVHCRDTLSGDGKIPLDDLVYVYMMSHSAESTGNDGVAYLGRTCTQRFFGPLWETYITLRSCVPNKQAATIRKKGKKKKIDDPGSLDAEPPQLMN